MDRLTEYHCGVAVIKDKNKLKEAMAKLARYEDAEEAGLLITLPRFDPSPLLDTMHRNLKKMIDYMKEGAK